jgi:hypothetical protein
MKIFTITLVDDGEKITAQADYTGEPGDVLDLGLGLMSDLAALDGAGERVAVSRIIRSAWVH